MRLRKEPAIQLKSAEQVDRMYAAGQVVARTLEILREAVRPGVSTAELDAIAEREIRRSGAVPSFLGYFGYPASICTSVNEQVVHGIPSAEQVLRSGDIISIDCGAILDGWHGDSALSLGVPRQPGHPGGRLPGQHPDGTRLGERAQQRTRRQPRPRLGPPPPAAGHGLGGAPGASPPRLSTEAWVRPPRRGRTRRGGLHL